MRIISWKCHVKIWLLCLQGDPSLLENQTKLANSYQLPTKCNVLRQMYS